MGTVISKETENVQENLDSFLALAEELKLNGLTTETSNIDNEEVMKSSPSNFNKEVKPIKQMQRMHGISNSTPLFAKGAGASEAGGQTKEGPLSKRYFQTSKIAQNRTKSPVPIVIDVFGVTAPYGNPYGSKIAIVWLFFVIF